MCRPSFCIQKISMPTNRHQNQMRAYHVQTLILHSENLQAHERVPKSKNYLYRFLR